MWMLRDWLGGTIEFGHKPSKKEALIDGQAAKDFRLNELELLGKNNAKKKGK